MSYPPPSTPGQQPYGQPPQYGQQRQYGPQGYYQPPQQQPPDEEEQRRKSRKRKYTAAGVLGVAASIATILTLFITLDQQPQQNNTPNTVGDGTTVANAYPVNVQSNFLNSCEANGSQSVCQCSLNWFEQHVPISQFEQDETEIEQGGQPADIVSVEQACG